MLLLYATFITFFALVNADFTLTVNFTNYTNPSGLCAECSTRLGDVSLAQIVPVCCDESPFKTDNCNNTGEARCDTRFRWTLRTFGASLVTRPVTVQNANTPPYEFNPCPQSSATCPFSEMSKTFEQGDMAFLERPNPFSIHTSEPWTGRIQFFIESVDSGVPNIIDSFLINLNNLQLGADFTEEMTFTGYHNIAHMTMSFKVECAPNYCGIGCVTTLLNNPQVLSCTNNGELVCNDGFDPSLDCNNCLYNRNRENCSLCLNENFNPATNCSTCLNVNFNPTTNCSTCLNENFNPTTNCSTCLNENFNPTTNCSTCLNESHNPDTNCTTCLNENFDLSQQCNECVVPGGDPQTSCTTCLLSGALIATGCSVTETPTNPGNDFLVSGIIGGLAGVFLLIIIVLIAVVIALSCHIRKSGRKNINKSDDMYGATTDDQTKKDIDAELEIYAEISNNDQTTPNKNEGQVTNETTADMLSPNYEYIHM